MMIKMLSQWLMPFLLCDVEIHPEGGSNSFGDIANNLFVPFTLMSSFLSAASLVIGAGFLLRSIVRFSRWRRNPIDNPLSTVFFLFFLGVFLLLLPFIYHLTESGIPGSVDFS